MDMRSYTKIEEVNNKTYCIYMEVGGDTSCYWDLTVGEWFWSEDIYKIYHCFKDVIVGETIRAYFELNPKYEGSDEEINLEELEGNILVGLAQLSIEDKKVQKALRKIGNRLIGIPQSFEALNNKIIYICDIFKSIDIPLNITFVKGFSNCIPLLKAHDAFALEKTGKEMLENDNFF